MRAGVQGDIDQDGYETANQLATQQFPSASVFVPGAIIGMVELLDCLQDFYSDVGAH